MIKISPNPSDMILIDISRFEKNRYDIYIIYHDIFKALIKLQSQTLS